MKYNTAHKNYVKNKNLELEKQTLSISEAATLLKISPTSLRRFEDAGKISSFRKDNGYRFFSRQEILTLKISLAKKEEKGKQQALNRRAKRAILAAQQQEIQTSAEVILPVDTEIE